MQDKIKESRETIEMSKREGGGGHKYYQLLTLATSPLWPVMVLIVPGFKLGSKTLMVLSVEQVNRAPGV